jgi:hypothetical protein
MKIFPFSLFIKQPEGAFADAQYTAVLIDVTDKVAQVIVLDSHEKLVGKADCPPETGWNFKTSFRDAAVNMATSHFKEQLELGAVWEADKLKVDV